ncbi:MAG: Do family serine endopeptidase [Deltaproteobacteria bacterium]|nr:Do family serine endopeptidase [Deltaproteobacteria bacterium]
MSFRSWFKKPLGYVLAGATAAAVSMAIYGAAQLVSQAKSKKVAALDNPAVAETKVGGSDAGLLRQTSESFRQIAKVVGPAVVNIKATRALKHQGPRVHRRGKKGEEEEGPFGRDPFFDFFERFGPLPFMQPEGPQESLGSGVIIDKRGYVVTNNHVIEGSTKIAVLLSGDKPTELKAKVVGSDPKTDLAVLKVENGKDLPTAEWADSDSVEVGDWAIAIGSPFALGQSVTVGIVSAKGRSSKYLTGADYGELIQTDAAINPGNSGGPLCTLDAKIMGVNTAIYTRSGGYMGIGFAIPSNLAKEVVSKLISEGKVIRGWLGVFIQPLDEELAKELGVKTGVGIHEVMEESPAARAGLKAGDVVIEVDGKPVKEVTQLQRVITSYKPGQTIKIKVVSYADKKTRTISVKIGELPAETENQPKLSREDETPDKLGLIVSEAKGKDGVIIDMIQPGSVADQVGLEVGDQIIRINRKTVNSVRTYKQLTSGSKRLYLEVRRKGRTLFYQFVLPE